MTVTLQDWQGRHKLRIERRLAHPVERVWRSVTEPQHLGVWYPATVTKLEPWPGGRLEFDYGEGEVSTGEVTEFDAPRVFAFVEHSVEDMPREGDSLMRFELHPVGEQECLLVLEQLFDDLPAAPSYAAGWMACLDVLEGDLAGEPQAAEPAASVDRFEGYLTEFGLDRPSAQGSTVRIERQLMMQPVDKVWRVIAPGGEPDVDALVPAGVTGAQVRDSRPGEGLDLALPGSAHITWALETGPGGARLVVTHEGAEDPATTAEAWREHVAALVRRIIATA
jgi:uncharacterized protein YndB with AHSA1/START domain